MEPHRKKSRLFEFFIVAGVSDIAQLHDGKAKAEVLEVLPKPAQDEELLLRDISMFCFPDGVSLRTQVSLPTFFTFVLTDALGARLYGSCLVFDEPVFLPEEGGEKRPPPSSSSSGSVETRKAKHFLPKSICVVSRIAYMALTKKYLSTLYSVCKRNGFTESFPLESYIANLLEVPLPPPGKVALSFTLPGEKIFQCASPGLHDFPLVDFSFHALFHSLDVNNVLRLLQCTLLEKKILLISKHRSLLSIAAETLCAIMLPFGWRRVYIPVLARDLIEITDAPTPFIMGIHDSYLPFLPELKEVAFVDLDHNRLDIAEKLPEFPEAAKNQLIEKLSYHIHPSIANIDFAFDPREVRTKEEDMEYHQNSMRAAFLRFFAALFADYNHREKNTNAEEQRFIANQSAEGREFYEQFFATEVWMSFHSERRSEADDLYHDFVGEFRRRIEPIRRLRSTSSVTGNRVEDTREKRKETGEEPEREKIVGAGGSTIVVPGGAEVGNGSGGGTTMLGSGGVGLMSDVEAQYAFLLKRFGKTDTVFAVPPPKPIYTEDKGTLSVTYGTVPVVNMPKKKGLSEDVDWMQPIKFPHLRYETFSIAFVNQTNMNGMIKQLTALIEATPEVMQYYVIRAALLSEMKQYLHALKDYDTLWRLMFGYNTFINHNKDLMVDIFDKLPQQELNQVASIGTFTKSLLEEHRRRDMDDSLDDDNAGFIDEDGSGASTRPKIGSSDNVLSLQTQTDIVMAITAPPDMFDEPIIKSSPKTPPAHTYIASGENGATKDTAAPATGAASADHGAVTEFELEVSVNKMSQLPAEMASDKTMTSHEFIDFALSGGLTNDYIDAEKLCEALGRKPKRRHVQKFLRYLREGYSLSQDTMWSDRLIRGEIVLRSSSSSVNKSNGQRGYLILTNHRLFFSPKKLERIGLTNQAIELCKLNEITSVEKYNYKPVIPPGFPCINVNTRSHNPGSVTKKETFCFLSWVERDIWLSYLTEMKGAYDVATYLDSPIVIPLAAHRIMITEAMQKLKKKPLRTLFRFLDLLSQKYYRTAKKLEARGVLNSSYLWEEKMPVRPACMVVEELLHSLISLFLAHVQPDGQSIDFLALTSTPDYKIFEKASAELQRVNIKELSVAQRTAFFVNTYNALTIHGYIMALSIPSQAVEWRYFSRAACYTIMGLPFSLDIIHHGILRGNRAWPLFAHRPLAEGDPRLQWVIHDIDPMVHFALSIHSESSPYLRIFEARNLGDQLKAATEDFLSTAVQVIAKDKRQVILPQVLSTYWRDFGEFHPEKDAPQLIERWVLPFLSGNKQKQLQLFLQEGSFDVQYYYSWKPEPKPYRQL